MLEVAPKKILIPMKPKRQPDWESIMEEPNNESDLMAIPHQNLVLKYNSNNQHKMNTIDKFEGTTMASPNDIRLKASIKLEL